MLNGGNMRTVYNINMRTVYNIIVTLVSGKDFRLTRMSIEEVDEFLHDILSNRISTFITNNGEVVTVFQDKVESVRYYHLGGN